MTAESGRPGGLSSSTEPQSVSALRASIPDAGNCGYWHNEWACREGGFLWDTDGDGYDPSDCTHPCPACNTVAYLRDGIENAQCLSQYQWIMTSGAEEFRYRVARAMEANPAVAGAYLNEVGPVACLDWADPDAPHFDRVVEVIENAQAIEARRAETGTGSVEDESAVPQGCAQGHSDDH